MGLFSGQILGAWLGELLVNLNSWQGKFAGVDLMPQEEVSLGMAFIVSNKFPETGGTILPFEVSIKQGPNRGLCQQEVG